MRNRSYLKFSTKKLTIDFLILAFIFMLSETSHASSGQEIINVASLKKKARKGYAKDRYVLGVLYNKGLFIKQDYKKWIKGPRKSAPQVEAAVTLKKQKQKWIQQSIARYQGNCPCPYSTMKNGRRCAGRSAWSRPGGASPLCYPSDIKNDDLKKKGIGP